MSVALIAGEGLLPEVIASRMASAGNAPVVYALRPDLGTLPANSEFAMKVSGGEVKAAFSDMKRRGVKQVILAGRVSKTIIFETKTHDLIVRGFLHSLKKRDDHSLLGGVVKLFEMGGFEVIPYNDIVGDLIAGSGQIAGRKPTKEENEDIALGREVARAVVPLSFGQSVVVSGRAVVAVEAMEGTDKTILRAGEITHSGVVVKMMKPGQDIRYDLPTVGPMTLDSMTEAGLTCLALHAGHTLIMERERFAALAEERSIAVIGFEETGKA